MAVAKVATTAPVLAVSSRGSRCGSAGAFRNDGSAHPASTAKGSSELKSVESPPKSDVSCAVSQKNRQPATNVQTGQRHPLISATQSPPAQTTSHSTTMMLNPPPIDPAILPTPRDNHASQWGGEILVMNDVIAVRALELPPCQNSVEGNSCSSAPRATMTAMTRNVTSENHRRKVSGLRNSHTPTTA